MEVFLLTLFLSLAKFAAGWGVIVFLLWIRPEYRFLLFYTFANVLLVFLFSDVWALTWDDAPAYVVNTTLAIVVTLVVGTALVALFKWLKTRKTGRDKQLDSEMERIRAEIAVREDRGPSS